MDIVNFIMNFLAILAALVVGLFGNGFLKSYVSKKGKNLATKEDVQEITKKIEEVKAEYAKTLVEYEVRFSRYYEEHTKIIAELYRRLARAHQGLEDTIGFSVDELNLAALFSSFRTFYEYFDENRVYFQPSTAARITDLYNEFISAGKGLRDARNAKQRGDVQNEMQSWLKSVDRLNKDIPALRKELESEFRIVLGGMGK